MFANFINAVIMINMFTLAQDRYNIDQAYENLLEKINIALSLIFFLEMILMLVGIGFREYIKDGYNIFDALIVVTLVLDMAIYYIMSQNEQANRLAISAVRSFRFLRIFKLAKYWK